MRVLTGVLLIFSGLILAAGFGGSLHGLGDTLAILRPVLAPLVAVLAVVAVLSGPRRLGVAGICLALVSGWSLFPPAPASAIPEGAQTYRVYQKNLLWNLRETAPVAADIREAAPDFVMLQELHRNTRPILDSLSGDYPHRQFCPLGRVGGIAVLSRWPPTGTTPVCGDDGGFAAMQVATPDGPLWVVSLHLHWPYPYRQPDQVANMLPALETLDRPVLVAGDFNMVPWSHVVRAIAGATGTELSGYAGGTFGFSYAPDGWNMLKHLPSLPIDHILIPGNGTSLTLERRGRLGSDHNGLVAEFALAGRHPEAGGGT